MPVREILLVITVAVVLAGGLLSPQIAVLGYVWFALMRPDALAWSDLPFSLALAVVALAASSRYLPRAGSLLSNPVIVALLVFQVAILLSVFAAVNPQLSIAPYKQYLKIVVTALLIPLVIDSEIWFRRLILVMALSLGFVAAKFALFSLLHGGVQYTWGFAGYMSDSNGLALGMAMAMPIIWYARELISQRVLRAAMVGLAASALITLVMTHSRGSSLAAAVACFLVVLYARRRSVSLLAVAAMVIAVVFIAGDAYIDRMYTLRNPDITGTRLARLLHLEAALKMWRDYPLFGVGWGEQNYVALSAGYLGFEDDHVVHNTYAQVLVDSGAPAFLAYLTVLFGTILWLTHSANRMREVKPEWEVYPRILQVSLVAFAVGSSFYSRGDFEFAYFLIAASAAWYGLSRSVVEAQGAPLPPAAVLTGRPALPPAPQPVLQSIRRRLASAPRVSQRLRGVRRIRERMISAAPIGDRIRR